MTVPSVEIDNRGDVLELLCVADRIAFFDDSNMIGLCHDY